MKDVLVFLGPILSGICFSLLYRWYDGGAVALGLVIFLAMLSYGLTRGSRY